jgi:hypothetical protein
MIVVVGAPGVLLGWEGERGKRVGVVTCLKTGIGTLETVL